MAKWLANEASKDRSFAGPFAYYQNSPAKVFMGDSHPVPASFMIQALSKMQSGNAGEEEIYAAGKCLSMQQNPCMESCSLNYSACLEPSDQMEDKASQNVAACNEQYGNCAAVCKPPDVI